MMSWSSAMLARARLGMERSASTQAAGNIPGDGLPSNGTNGRNLRRNARK